MKASEALSLSLSSKSVLNEQTKEKVFNLIKENAKKGLRYVTFSEPELTSIQIEKELSNLGYTTFYYKDITFNGKIKEILTIKW